MAGNNQNEKTWDRKLMNCWKKVLPFLITDRYSEKDEAGNFRLLESISVQILSASSILMRSAS